MSDPEGNPTQVSDDTPKNVVLEEEFPLPSGGFLYDEDDIPSTIALRPMRVADEKLMIGGKNTGFIDRVIKLFKSCSTTPNVKWENMVNQDMMYILFMLRKLSFGPIYEAQTKCSSCSELIPLDISIPDSFGISVMTDDAHEKTWDIEISDGMTFTMGYVTSKKMIEVERIQKQRKIRSRGREVEDPNLLIMAHIKKIDGEHKSIQDIDRIVDGLLVNDFNKLRNSIEDNDFGLKLKIPVDCVQCGWSEEQAVPMGNAFFRPRS